MINFLQAKYSVISFIRGFYLWLNMTLTLSWLFLWDSLVLWDCTYTHRLPCNQIGLFYSPCEFPDIHTHTHACTLSLFVSVNNKKNAMSPVVMLLRVYECVCGFCRETESAVLYMWSGLVAAPPWLMSEASINIRVWASRASFYNLLILISQ